jgi:hypothetical protein
MKMIKFLGWICIGACLTLPVVAKDKPGKGRSHKDPEPNLDTSSVEAGLKLHLSLSDEERRIIRAYVDGCNGRNPGKTTRPLPPGLAKKVARGEELPPGWEKKCAPGEIMPVEVFEKCQPLPPELVIKLPPPPTPTVTVTIGGQVVRLIKATREILDVLNVHTR